MANIASQSEQALASVTVEPYSDVPLYQQAYEQLRELIIQGRLPAGHRVPSTRDFSEDLGVSRKTIVTAYDQLIAEGYLRGETGAGTYVDHVPGLELRKVSGSGQDEASRVDHLPLTNKMAPLSPAAPDTDHFPLKSWSRAAARGQRSLGLTAMFNMPLGGYAKLRSAICNHLKAMRGLVCEPSQIVVTSSVFESVDLICGVLLQPDDKIVMGNPAHAGIQRRITSHGIVTPPVPVDENGIVVSSVLARHSDAAAVFITPSRQCPLGVQLSLPRRLKLLSWAAQNEAWIIEDDYDCEYRFSGRPLQSMYAIDTAERTIYLGSFSKVLFPNLRISFIVAPQTVADRIIQLENLDGNSTSMPTQAALAEFMDSGQLGTHIRKMRRLYERRYKHLLREVERELGDYVTVEEVEGGIYFVARFRPEVGSIVSDQKIVSMASDAGLGAQALSSYYRADKSRNQGLVLGFAGASEDVATASVKKLRAIFKANLS